jgi:cytochrome P450
LAEAVLQGSMMRADFTSQAYFRNPAAEIEKLRSAGPVVEVQFPMVGKVWTTTTQDLADRVLKDSETFTIRDGIGGVAGLQWWMPRIVRTLANHMLSKDEPDHKRLRDVVDEAFRRRAVLEMEPRILAIADELAGELFAEGWASGFTRLTGTIGLLSLIPNILAMGHYLEKQLKAVRENGGTGLIAELVRVEKEGEQISRDEMVAMVFLLLFAGHETTTHLISGSVYELLRNPALRDWLEEDWSRAGLAVEEFLRFISVVQFTKPRFVRKEIELGGIQLKRGENHAHAGGSQPRSASESPPGKT